MFGLASLSADSWLHPASPDLAERIVAPPTPTRRRLDGDHLLATVSERHGAPSPSCSTAWVDAYHQQTVTGFDPTLTCNGAPANTIGWLVFGLPNPTGTPIPQIVITSYPSLAGPVGSLLLNSDATGHASFRFQAGITPPSGLAVQTVWIGNCASFEASDAIRL